VIRTRAWLVVSPVIAAGVLVAHTLAYRLTSTPTGPFHEYLGHAPQVLLLLALSGLVLSFGAGRDAPAAWGFPVAALATFTLQEHLERALHGGGVPVLVLTPVFVVGLLLQVPVALLAWLVARRLLAVAVERIRVALRPRLDFPLVRLRGRHVAALARPTSLSRGPPLPAPSR
jgi:hypothetical protein